MFTEEFKIDLWFQNLLIFYQTKYTLCDFILFIGRQTTTGHVQLLKLEVIK